MRRNTVKERLAKGEAVIGTMVREMFSAASFQVFKAAGIHLNEVEALRPRWRSCAGHDAGGGPERTFRRRQF